MRKALYQVELEGNFMRCVHNGFRAVVVARAVLAVVVGLLFSVSGVTGNYGEGRPVVYSDWPATDGGVERVGSFVVGKPRAERFVGGLFDEWREVILPEVGRVDPLLRQEVRDRLFFNREGADFNEYLRGRRDDLLLRLNRASADYLTGRLTEGAEAAAGRHSFVRTVEWDYQSSLGKRRWQTGLNVVGALRETAADAVVWQLRGYAAKESSGGANVGLIYRRVVGESLAGANVFLDYEDHDYGSFSRWSLGGELRGGWGGVFVNRYMVLSDAKTLGDGWIAYSRDGFDVAAEFRIPTIRWVSGGLTYYRFDGEYGQADEKGFRYHGAFDFAALPVGGDFWGGLSFALEYDNGDGDWGGRLAYRYRFGAATPAGGTAAGAAFDARAHFFDPVRREYAQRISRTREDPSKAAGTEILGVVATVVGDTAGRATLEFDTGRRVSLVFGGADGAYVSTATVTARVAEAATTLQVASSRWTVQLRGQSTMNFLSEGRQLHLQWGTVYVRSNGVIRHITTPSLTIALQTGIETVLTVIYPHESSRATLSRLDISKGVLSVSVGLPIDEVVTLSISSDDVTVTLVTPSATVAIRGSVRYGGQTVLVPFGWSGAISTLSVSGGDATGYRPVVLSPLSLYAFVGQTLSVVAPHSITVVSTVRVRIGDDYSHAAEGAVVLSPHSRLSVAPLSVVWLRSDALAGRALLTLSVSGGLSPYRYAVVGDGVATGGTDGVFSLGSAGSGGERRVVTVVVRDQTPFNALSLQLTVAFYDQVGFSSGGGARRVAADYEGVVYTVAAVGGRGTIRYSSATPQVSVATGGGVYLTVSLAGADLSVGVLAEDSLTNEDSMFALSLLNAPIFVPPPLPTLYAEAGAAAGGVLGRLSGGAVYGEMADPQDRVSVDAASGAVYLRTALSFAGLATVTLAAGEHVLGNERRPVAATIFFYDRIEVSSPLPYNISAGVGGVYHTLLPRGGSGVYDYKILRSAGGGIVSVPGRGASSRLSLAGVAAGVTLSAVIEVRDAVISVIPPAKATVRFIGTEGLAFAGLSPMYYVRAGDARRTLVRLGALGGVSPRAFSEFSDHANFEITPQSVLVFVNAPATLGAYSVTLRVTDSNSPVATAMAVVVASIYMPLTVSPATVWQTIAAMRTGAVHTVSAALGSGGYRYAAATTPAGHEVNMAGRVLVLNRDLSSLAGGRLTVSIRVSEAGTGYGDEEVMQAVLLHGVPPLSLSPLPLISLRPNAAAGQAVLTLSVGGGVAPYRQTMRGDGLSLDSWVLSLSTAGAAGETRKATVLITDGTSFNRLEVTITVAFRPYRLTVGRLSVQYVAVPSALPLALPSLTVAGTPPYEWSVLADDGGVLGVATDGGSELTATLPAGTRATVSVLVFDADEEAGTGAVTLAFYRPLSAPASLTVTVRSTYIGALLTMTVSDGTGEFAYTASPPGFIDVTVDAAGVVSLQYPLGGLLSGSLTIGISDRLGGERATVHLVVDRYIDPLSFTPGEADYLLSPHYTGFVHRLEPRGGYGSYSHRRVSGTTALEVSRTGAISLRATLKAGSREQAVYSTRDYLGSSVQFLLNLEITDSPENYTQEEMYLVGGNNSKSQNDIWHSADGLRWTRVLASSAFSSRTQHQMVVHNGSLWVGGGLIGILAEGDIWHSADGLHWTKADTSSPFLRRNHHQMVSHNGDLWLVAGAVGNAGIYANDIWHSSDGLEWMEVNSPSRFQARINHQLVSHNGSLWMSGGFSAKGQVLGDIWRSATGVNWTQVNPVSIFFESRQTSDGFP